MHISSKLTEGVPTNDPIAPDADPMRSFFQKGMAVPFGVVSVTLSKTAGMCERDNV